MPLSGDTQYEKPTSWWAGFKQVAAPLFAWWPEFRKSKIGIAGLVIIIVMVALILLAPVLATHAPTGAESRDFDIRFQPPSWQHIMGTNSIGQDVWSRLLHSGRNSLMIGFVAAFLITSIGSALGMISGYFGGIIEELVMRLADILLIIPRLPLLIILSAYLSPGPWTVIMLLTVTGWAGIARSTRAQTLSVKQHSYVEAARSVGASNIRIIIQHILPNVAGIIIAAFAMEVVVAILVESGLSFLGLGDLSQPTWGVMLHFAQTDAAFSWNAWWWIIPPGACIALLGLAFAYVGNTLNDRFVLRLGSRRKG